MTGRTDPWLVEWDATHKARMQAAALNGVLLVHYSGCELEVLYGCEQAGGYDIVPTTRSTNTEYITSEADVFAKLPVGALRLVGEFQQGDRWSLDYAILGMQQTRATAVDGAALRGECAQATHYVSAMAIGAYRLGSEAKRKAAAGVELFGAGAGVSGGGAAGLLRQAGTYEKCASSATASDQDCQAVVQLFLEPIVGAAPPAPVAAVAVLPESAVAEPVAEPIASESPMPQVDAGDPSRFNAASIVSLSAAVVGLGVGIAGWAMFGKHSRAVNGYEDTMNSTPWNEWNVSNCETATKPDGTSASASDADWDYYCNELIQSRDDTKDKFKLDLGLGIGGSALFAVGGVLAAIFIANPEWFVDEGGEARLMLAPVATPDTAGLVLHGTF